MFSTYLIAAGSRWSLRSMLGGAVLAASAGTVCAQSVSQATAQSVVTCRACHVQKDLSSKSVVPNIWGQHEGYLYIQLRGFKSGTRQTSLDATMHGLTVNMTDAQMRELAAYIASQPWVSVSVKQPASAQLLEEGQKLAASGGCGGCHANNFGGFFSAPRLAGQVRGYLSTTLHQFARFERTDAPGMANNVAQLPHDQLDALAAYLESQTPTSPFLDTAVAGPKPSR